MFIDQASFREDTQAVLTNLPALLAHIRPMFSKNDICLVVLNCLQYLSLAQYVTKSSRCWDIEDAARKSTNLIRDAKLH